MWPAPHGRLCCASVTCVWALFLCVTVDLALCCVWVGVEPSLLGSFTHSTHVCMPAWPCVQALTGVFWFTPLKAFLSLSAVPPGGAWAYVWTPRLLVTSASGCSHMVCSW